MIYQVKRLKFICNFDLIYRIFNKYSNGGFKKYGEENSLL